MYAGIIISFSAYFLEKVLPRFYDMPLISLFLPACFHHLFVIDHKLSQIIFGSKWSSNKKYSHTSTGGDWVWLWVTDIQNKHGLNKMEAIVLLRDGLGVGHGGSAPQSSQEHRPRVLGCWAFLLIICQELNEGPFSGVEAPAAGFNPLANPRSGRGSAPWPRNPLDT